ncbi:hypothetical protein ACFSHP_02390 [Novosphingobium panipatense]
MTSSSDGPSPAAHRVSGDSAGRALEMPSPLSLAGTALFLDFDGTLVEIAEHPDDVRVSRACVGWWKSFHGRSTIGSRS